MNLHAGWSMTVGEMRKAIADVPDDYEIVIDAADVDDCEIAEAKIRDLYPPALGSSGLLVVTCGQVISSEYFYHDRMDAGHMSAGYPYWDSKAEKWVQR